MRWWVLELPFWPGSTRGGKGGAVVNDRQDKEVDEHSTEHPLGLLQRCARPGKHLAVPLAQAGRMVD